MFQSLLTVLFFLQPRAMKGISYITKQLDGGAASSTDEEEEDACSEAAGLDDNEENKSVNSPRSPKLKVSSSVVEKKHEVVSFVHLCLIMYKHIL